MFENQPTNPQIVAQLLNLADGWKELLGPDAEKPKKRRTASKRTKAKS